MRCLVWYDLTLGLSLVQSCFSQKGLVSTEGSCTCATAMAYCPVINLQHVQAPKDKDLVYLRSMRYACLQYGNLLGLATGKIYPKVLIAIVWGLFAI